MKNIANRLFVFAAAALSLGTAAYGQTTLTTNVPFAFRTPGAVSPAGAYSVQLQASASGKLIQIFDARMHSKLAVAYIINDNPGTHVTPHLTFLCGGETGCSLTEIWTSGGGWAIPQKPRASREREYVASVPLTAPSK